MHIFLSMLKLQRWTCLPACLGLSFLMSCGSDAERAAEAYRAGDWLRSARFWDLVLDMHPADRNARLGLGLALFSAALDAEEAGLAADWSAPEAQLRILSRTDSSAQVLAMRSTCLDRLGLEALESGSTSNALPLLSLAIRLDSTNWAAMHLRASAYDRMGDTARARVQWEKVVASHPQSADSWMELGRLAWERNDMEGAWDHWSAGLEANPRDSRLRYWTGRAQEALEAEVLLGHP